MQPTRGACPLLRPSGRHGGRGRGGTAPQRRCRCSGPPRPLLLVFAALAITDRCCTRVYAVWFSSRRVWQYPSPSVNFVLLDICSFPNYSTFPVCQNLSWLPLIGAASAVLLERIFARHAKLSSSSGKETEATPTLGAFWSDLS